MARRKNSAELFELLNRLASEEAQKQDRSESDRSERRRTDERRSEERRSQVAASRQSSPHDPEAAEAPEHVAEVPVGAQPAASSASAGDRTQPGDTDERSRGYLSILSPGRQPVRKKGMDLRPTRRHGASEGRDSGSSQPGRSGSTSTPIDSIFESVTEPVPGRPNSEPEMRDGSRGRGGSRSGATDPRFAGSDPGSAQRHRSEVGASSPEKRKTTKRKTVRIRRDDSLTPEVVSRDGDATPPLRLRHDAPRSGRSVLRRGSRDADAIVEGTADHEEQRRSTGLPVDAFERLLDAAPELGPEIGTEITDGSLSTGRTDPGAGARDVASLPFPYNRILAAMQRSTSPRMTRQRRHADDVHEDSQHEEAASSELAQAFAGSMSASVVTADVHASASEAVATQSVGKSATASPEPEARSKLAESEAEASADDAGHGTGGDDESGPKSARPKTRRVIAKKRRGKGPARGGKSKRTRRDSAVQEEAPSGDGEAGRGDATPQPSEDATDTANSNTEASTAGNNTADPARQETDDALDERVDGQVAGDVAGDSVENDSAESDGAEGIRVEGHATDGSEADAPVDAADEERDGAVVLAKSAALAPKPPGRLRQVVELVIPDEIVAAFRRPLEVRVSTLFVAAVVLSVVVALGLRYRDKVPDEGGLDSGVAVGGSASDAGLPAARLLEDGGTTHSFVDTDAELSTE